MCVKKILFLTLVLALCVGFVFAACGRNVTITNGDGKYDKYEQLFSYLESGDFESAHSYIHDFFGVTETQPKATDPAPTQEPTVPIEPTSKPTEPATVPSESIQPTTQPTEPPTEPTEPSTEPTEPSTEPTQPSTEPTQPSTEPSQPPTEPSQPPTEPTQPPTEPTQPTTEPTEPSTEPTEPETEMVWIPKSGTKYHCRPDCSNMKAPTQVTKEEAENQGYTPCKKCYKS